MGLGAWIHQGGKYSYFLNDRKNTIDIYIITQYKQRASSKRIEKQFQKHRCS